MKSRPARLVLVVVLGLLLSAQAAWANEPLVGERLSDWLLRQTPGGYPTALHWQVPQERPAQDQLKQVLLAQLTDAQAAQLPRVAPLARARLTRWLQALPVTGRVALALPDARWLQAHPGQDPVLQADQRLHLPQRPAHVTLILSSGEFCQLHHRAGTDADSYLQACLGADTRLVDTVWLAQPDGHSIALGIAPWNAEPQDEPAPGAWIWAPTRDSGFTPAFSEGLIRFLATQEHAPANWATTALHRRQPAQQEAPLAPRKRDFEPTASDWGSIGLLQTPTARMAADGDFRSHISSVRPYTRINVMFQPLDWLEAGFRYTDIANRDYDNTGTISSQSYKDKSIDLKVRLMRETARAPELALGIRDLGGTGLFSGEYMVANKRWGDFDWSLGLGWGYLGARGNLNNPLAWFDPKLNQRTAPDSAQGGTVNTNSMFTGPTALFGGLQWHAPHTPLLLKLELDGNHYQREPQANNQTVTTPFNAGLVYRYSPSVDFHVGVERGNQWLFGLTLHTNLRQLGSPKLLDPPTPRFTPQPPASPPRWQSSAADIERLTGWQVLDLQEQGNALHLRAVSQNTLYAQERLQRLIAVLHRDAPAHLQRFVIVFADRGFALHAEEVDRVAWIASQHQGQASSLARPPHQSFVPDPDWITPPPNATVATPAPSLTVPRPWQFGLDPIFSHVLGGPDAFVLYQFGVQATGEYRLGNGTWLSGTALARVLDNYSLFRFTGHSDLPRVRTYAREFATTSPLNLADLQLTHARQLGQNHFVSIYGGLLESMYAGVGAEWLYRPWRSPLALGLDLNHAHQRGFAQDFSLRDYSVNTGHLSLYWDTGWQGLLAKVSMGQYLAGDRGATLDVSRRYPNGVVIGAYATKTNVSDAQFGEGSFDKGIYMSMPIDALLPRSSEGKLNFNWSPLTRDGGARLARGFPLYELTSLRDRQAMRWATPDNRAPRTGAPLFQAPANLQATPDLGHDLTRSARTLGQQMTDGSSAPAWLAAAGLVVGARLLDPMADDWARQQTGNRVRQSADFANSLPWLAAAGVGTLSLGWGDDDLARTAWTSLKATGATLASNAALRWSVGRARPRQELGPSHFEGFTPQAVDSGFASNHVAATFALLTPFAQQYQQPWLYGLAGLTGYGRLQQREHWLSDVVAGGALGYAVGSLMLDQQRAQAGKARVLVGPASVQAQWEF